MRLALISHDKGHFKASVFDNGYDNSLGIHLYYSVIKLPFIPAALITHLIHEVNEF